MVFEEVFPRFIAALATHDPRAPTPLTGDYLEECRQAALVFLYRLLFVFYAEDRNLLPTLDGRYDDYSLRKIRHEIADRIDPKDAFSSSASRYHSHTADLFRAIGEGDASIGLPPYNGGLFDAQASPLLERTRLPDSVLAELIDRLSRHELRGHRAWINYRDLSVRHLGSIYERLLEFDAVVNEDGQVELRPNPFARKGSGSYYTHDDLVQLIIQETLGPLVEEIAESFQEKSRDLAGDRRSKNKRLAELASADAAARLLDLKVCDPAMGSGHFLVSLVDYLADQVLEQMAAVDQEVEWASEVGGYESPVADRIRRIREQILAAAEQGNWVLDAERLDDRHLVRRMVLKRVIYGVDKNPMAVELAKVALWLHTFTVGAPLSFLDHHLRCGDSLFGEWVDGVAKSLQEVGALHIGGTRARLRAASQTFHEIAMLTDVDIGEVRRSEEFFGQGEATLRPLRKLLDFWHALAWLPGKKKRGLPDHPGLRPLMQKLFGELLGVLEAGRVESDDPKQRAEVEAVNELLQAAEAVVKRERFLPWEVAFPTVWKEIDRAGGAGGFDAVIGNPPWDRVKFQQVEWFAARERDIAASPRAADRKRKIRALEASKHSLWNAYVVAKERAETQAAVARKGGQYPLLSKGDVNLYSLFVERAARLVRPGGIVGLLTPSGIAADKTAAEFFRSVATTGRLRALLDFENKKVFFPAVDSRFKFCVFIFGGPERTFPKARCAFFLHKVAEREEAERAFTMTAEDFAAVNPNTGTAPIFRSRRDAEITMEIYARFPILVDRRTDPPTKVWPVRYVTMFHMTNDSHLFKRRDELEAEGFYPVAGNRWKKGGDEYVPLYEGKMVQMYDHRAASVIVNRENLNRQAQRKDSTLGEHKDPLWLPTPRFRVDANVASSKHSNDWCVSFKEITAPTNRRTMIACVTPGVAFGNKLPLWLPELGGVVDDYRSSAPLLLANLNSFCFDFVARQKVHGQTLNLFLVEQLPTIPLDTFNRAIGEYTTSTFIRDQVLRLSYTAVDLEPFARDMGYEGDPFPWDEEDRRHRMARLDALFFHLYGIDRSDADYILNTFPIVKADDKKEFGRFLTRDLILAYMNAVAAGDLETQVSI